MHGYTDTISNQFVGNFSILLFHFYSKMDNNLYTDIDFYTIEIFSRELKIHKKMIFNFLN